MPTYKVTLPDDKGCERVTSGYFRVDEHGVLWFRTSRQNDYPEFVKCYAAGTWRSIETVPLTNVERDATVNDVLSDGKRVPWTGAPPVITERLSAMRVGDMSIGVRAEHALINAGIHTVGELLAKTRQEVGAIINIGKVSLAEIEEALADFGLALPWVKR